MSERRAAAFSRTARLVAAGLVALAASRAVAADVQISWDQDNAFEWDRASYERTLRQLVAASEAEVSSWLGWQRTRPLSVHVMTRARYEAQFGSGMAWNSGAHYSNGVINVNGGARLNAWFAAMLAHEMTHAYVDDRRTGGRFPFWLNEGLAERIAYHTRGQEGLDTTQRQELEVALEERRLVPIAGGGRGTLGFKYLHAFAAVLFLEQKIGKQALLAVVRRVMERGTVEQALDAELRWTMRNVEEGFTYWVDHLQ